MQPYTTKLRALLTIAAMAVVPLAIGTFTPAEAACQDDKVECEFEGMSI